MLFRSVLSLSLKPLLLSPSVSFSLPNLLPCLTLLSSGAYSIWVVIRVYPGDCEKNLEIAPVDPISEAGKIDWYGDISPWSCYSLSTLHLATGQGRLVMDCSPGVARSSSYLVTK